MVAASEDEGSGVESESEERMERRLKKVGFDIRKQRCQRGSSFSDAEFTKRWNHVGAGVEEWEGGAIGRDERRDSRRRDWDGGRRRSLVWRKERLAEAAEERRRSSGSLRRSFWGLFVGFLWDFRFLEFTSNDAS